MKTISQRELRNDNAEVVRGVEAGESYTITRRGVPVACLVPVSADADLRCDRPAKNRPQYGATERIRVDVAVSEVLIDLRGDR